MQLFRATDDFKINSQAYEDFPLILDNEMRLVRPAHEFLIHYCITRGRVQSKNSWWRFGQDMYDYFGFLEARNLDWKQCMASNQHSVIATYRDWSLLEGLSTKTINSRLRTIVQFYEFAIRKDWIDSVPFDIETVVINKSKGFLAHTDRSGSYKAVPNVMLKEKVSQLQILSKQEVKALMSFKTFVSQHLIYRMAIQTGLRKEELTTFPEKYIQNPISMSGSAMVPVRLNPKEMEIKGNKERTIHIPIKLYEKLWFYKIHERNQLLQRNEQTSQKTLFLNRFGKPYSIQASILNNRLKKAVGRKDISLHKLRHTYATFKLYALRNSSSYRGDPLVYIQDRLGHSSIVTTQVYLHYLENLEGDLMTQFEEDIDQICRTSEVV